MIARRDKLITNFGILMDPLADKILVCSAFIAFVDRGWIPAWMAVIVVAREVGDHGSAVGRRFQESRSRGGTFRQTQDDLANRGHHCRAREEQPRGMGPGGKSDLRLAAFRRPWVNWFTTVSLWLAVGLTFVSGTIYSGATARFTFPTCSMDGLDPVAGARPGAPAASPGRPAHLVL